MKRDRDIQRSKVYRAESAAFSEICKEKFTKGQSMDFVQCVLYSRYWKRCKGYKAVSLKFRNGGDRAAYYHRGRFITLPPWGRNEFLLIHELSHSITTKEDQTLASHGKVFCKHYINLVAEVLGYDHALDLEASFKEHKVKY